MTGAEMDMTMEELKEFLHKEEEGAEFLILISFGEEASDGSNADKSCEGAG